MVEDDEESFELLQWIRAYRPSMRTIIVGGPGAAMTRSQALESGALGYLEKPLDLHLLKEELRRLLQHTGFSASLDSFDLLDLIQIINISRKSIALLINTGLEERGVLRFQNGELIWAEYGILRGEEAFFALAAHKNGTVIHQPWNEQIVPNVAQPLSRLVLHALQYRSKYAEIQQLSGEQVALTRISSTTEIDDSPFMVLSEYKEQEKPVGFIAQQEFSTNGVTKEWWQHTGNTAGRNDGNGNNGAGSVSPIHKNGSVPSKNSLTGHQVPEAKGVNIIPSIAHKTAASQRGDLPAWLTDQPTASEIPAIRPSSLSNSTQMPAVSAFKPTVPPAEWQGSLPINKTTEPIGGKLPSAPQPLISTDTSGHRLVSPPEWQPPIQKGPTVLRSGPLPGLAPAHRSVDAFSAKEGQDSEQHFPSITTGLQQVVRRNYNYTALVSALQTLGYSIHGFIAAAVVGLDGQPIAQVAIDDLDISPMCKNFSTILNSVLESLDQGMWGRYEDTVITSADRHILMRIVGTDRNTFQVLITTHESAPVECLEVMANVEGAIAAALR